MCLSLGGGGRCVNLKRHFWHHCSSRSYLSSRAAMTSMQGETAGEIF